MSISTVLQVNLVSYTVGESQSWWERWGFPLFPNRCKLFKYGDLFSQLGPLSTERGEVELHRDNQ